MKKILVGLVMFLTVNVYGQLKPATQQPMYQARTLNAFSLYITTGAQTSSTFGVFITSVQFKSTGGLYAGTTGYLKASYTIKQFADYINAVSSITVGLEGKPVFEISTGCYSGDTLERLTQVNYTAVGNVSQNTVFTQSDTNGISLIIPAYKKYLAKNHPTGGIANAIFTSGSMRVLAYAGASADSTKIIDDETFSVSGVDANLDGLNIQGFTTTNLQNIPILFEIFNSTNITAGHVLINFFID